MSKQPESGKQVGTPSAALLETAERMERMQVEAMIGYEDDLWLVTMAHSLGDIHICSSRLDWALQSAMDRWEELDEKQHYMLLKREGVGE